VLNEQDWRLDIGGLVAHQRTLALAELKARARREVAFTMECSGNHGPRLPDGRPFFIGGIAGPRQSAGMTCYGLVMPSSASTWVASRALWGKAVGGCWAPTPSRCASGGGPGSGLVG
jgi:Oxidoreductase molybdopterin binding domain